MKVFFDIDYKNHNIKVTNKWNDCSLVIDDVVVDTYRALIAANFALKGNIKVGKEKVEIVFQLKNSFPRCKILLSANGEQLAMKKMFR